MPSPSPCAILFLLETRRSSSRRRYSSSSSNSLQRLSFQSPLNFPTSSSSFPGDGFRPVPNQLLANDATFGAALLLIRDLQHSSTTASRYPEARTTRNLDSALVTSSGCSRDGASTSRIAASNCLRRFSISWLGHASDHIFLAFAEKLDSSSQACPYLFFISRTTCGGIDYLRIFIDRRNRFSQGRWRWRT